MAFPTCIIIEGIKITAIFRVRFIYDRLVKKITANVNKEVSCYIITRTCFIYQIKRIWFSCLGIKGRRVHCDYC